MRKLVEFTKFLAKDISVLQQVKMDRTAATYKSRVGLSFHNHINLIDKVIKYPFSINMDEYTTNSNKRVFYLVILMK